MGVGESKLEQEFDYYLDNQDQLVKKYNGRVLVIKNLKVIGDYFSLTEADLETQKEHDPGTFLIQKCSSGDSDYTMTFHSRVIYN